MPLLGLAPRLRLEDGVDVLEALLLLAARAAAAHAAPEEEEEEGDRAHDRADERPERQGAEGGDRVLDEALRGDSAQRCDARAARRHDVRDGASRGELCRERRDLVGHVADALLLVVLVHDVLGDEDLGVGRRRVGRRGRRLVFHPISFYSCHFSVCR